MAQIDKVQIGTTSYDVAPSSAATFAGTSNDTDQASATSYTSVAKLESGETTGSIFTKISTMFKNIRYLSNMLGSTDFSATGQSTVTGALATLQSGKAASSHSHTTSDLPVSSTQVNSTSYVPTSSLVYSMKNELTSLNDAIENVERLGINDANHRFEERNIGTWSSLSQVDAFLTEYTHANDYRGNSTVPLKLGNYVTIQDGTYNVEWMIAGFDTEYNRGDTACGYGIGLIPKIHVTTGYMNSTNITTGGYEGSYMNRTTLPAIATKLQTVLGSHMISRRVLLSNAVNTSATSPGYSGWTGASSSWGWYSEYLTLLSEVQVYGSRVWGGGYDVGEACQKLPVFNYINHNQYSRSHFWLRAVTYSTAFALAYYGGVANYDLASYSLGVRPLLYLR